MTSSDFETLLQIIGCKISRTDTKHRAAIPRSIRLAVTLKYFASGESFTSLMHIFKIYKQSMSAVIPEVCETPIDALKTYVKMTAIFLSFIVSVVFLHAITLFLGAR